MYNSTSMAFAVILLGGWLISGCGSTNPPLQQLAETETIINQAQQIGANDYAPLEIREARIKLGKARELMSDGDYELAAMTAEQAKADAELAHIKTLSGKSLLALNELRESIRILKEEILNRFSTDPVDEQLSGESGQNF
jgi:SMC interacting uncharacterized protein involved in chromosome segregation